jgi:hypothetical protein
MRLLGSPVQVRAKNLRLPPPLRIEIWLITIDLQSSLAVGNLKKSTSDLGQVGQGGPI